MISGVSAFEKNQILKAVNCKSSFMESGFEL